MNHRLLQLLVCPVCKGPLDHRRPPLHAEEALVCRADALGIPGARRHSGDVGADGTAAGWRRANRFRRSLTASASPRSVSALPAAVLNVGYTVLIPARMASSRLPGKPLLGIAGVPMVVRVARRAAKSAATRVVVATGDAAIVACCAEHGVDSVRTRIDHATGSDRLAEASTLLGLTDDACIVNVQGDEPLIEPALMDACAALLHTRPECAMGTAAHPISSVDDYLSASVVKVVVDREGRALLFSRAPIPHRRADATDALPLRLPDPPPLRHVGLYAYRAGFLRRFAAMPEAPMERSEALEQLRALWWGEGIAVHVASGATAPGVDTPADLERMQQLCRDADHHEACAD